MDTIKFTGWVEKMLDADMYKREIVVTNYKGDAGKEKMIQAFKDKTSKEYPVALKLQASIKSGASAQLDDVHEGDKIQVQFCISGKSGVSKKTGNYYAINELNICKKDGVVILERAAISEQTVSADDDEADIPF